MTTTTVGYVYKVAGPPNLRMPNDNIVANIFDPLTKNIWFYEMHVYAAADLGSAVNLRLVAYESATGHSLETAPRIGYSALAGLSTGYAERIVNVSHSDNSPSNSAFMGFSGKQYAFAAYGHGGEFKVATPSPDDANSLPINDHNYRFYGVSAGLWSTPPALWSTTYSSYGGAVMGIWAVGDVNSRPLAPASLTPAANATINDLTPTIGGSFRDLNGNYGIANGGADRGDRLYKVNIVVKRVSDGATMWNTTYDATSTEVTANAFSIDYNGTTLIRGETYQWRARVSDQFGEWSDYSSYQNFTVANVGFVTVTSPIGKIETTTTSFGATYSHDSGLSANAVQVALYDSTGATIAVSPIITKSVANGASFTVTFAETTFATLIQGKVYKVRIKARDTANNWGNYSSSVFFNVNSPPGIPTGLSPTGSIAVTTPPTIKFTMVDIDDTTLTGLVGKFRIQGEQAIPNPSFATDITGWQEQADIANVTETLSFDGTQNGDGVGGSLKLNMAASTLASGVVGPVIYTSKAFRCFGGYPITFSLWVRTDNILLVPRLRLIYYTDTAGTVGATALTESTWTPVANTWVQRTVTLTPSASARSFRVGMGVLTQGASQNGNLWIDGLDFSGPYIIYVDTATLNLTSGKWEKLLDTTNHLPEIDMMYYFDAYGYDGTWYTGGTATETSATRSALSSFQYVTGHTVTLTSPANGATITQAGLTFGWSVVGGTQSTWLVEVFDSATNVRVYASNNGVATSGPSTAHVLPAGYLVNNGTYYATVTIKSTLNITVSSSPNNFTVTFTPPAVLTGLVVTPSRQQYDLEDTSNILQWDQSSEANFDQYIVYRSDLSRPLGRIYSITLPYFTDYFPPLDGTEVVYSITQVTSDTLGDIESDAVFEPVSLITNYAYLANTSDPANKRVPLEFVQTDDVSIDRTRTQFQPINADRVTTIERRLIIWAINVSAVFPVPDSDVRPDPTTLRLAFESVMYASPMTLCYRDGDFKRFCTPSNIRLSRAEIGMWKVTFTLTEEKYTEGVV